MEKIKRSFELIEGLLPTTAAVSTNVRIGQ